MKYLMTLLFYFCLTLSGFAQEETYSSENEFSTLKPPSTVVVPRHKDNLRLTLIVDSIILGRKKVVPNFRITIPVNFESDYIKIKDSLCLKIFIARNQEYGNKFYSWKWDFLKKRDSQFYSQGVSSYEVMEFNGSLDPNRGAQGHGVGIEGTPGFVMYYYRYKLE